MTSATISAPKTAIQKIYGARFNDPRMDTSPLGMGVNVGRAVIQRACEFKNKEDSIFETIANGYEAYDFGEAPKVSIDIVLGKNGYIMVKDWARGMDRMDLRRFLSLHAHTLRRDSGRNTRGYNGTGKVAFLVTGRVMRIDTVRNGFRNVVIMCMDEIEKAAINDTPIVLKEPVVNEPTTDPNGTTITILKLHNPMKAEDVRALREKVSMEMMMWMDASAEILINNELVEPQKLEFDSQETVVSDCGNFTAKILYKEAGYKENLAHTFISCGKIFAARENFGKEGHKYSNKVHAAITTTEEWAAKHFNHRRERFVSESRDLKLKTGDPKARELRDFAIKAVSQFMKKLVDEEDQRRRDEDNKLMREWETDLSRAFSSMWNLGSSRSRSGSKPRVERKVRAKVSRKSLGDKARVTIAFKRLDDPKNPYLINHEARFIEVNLNHEHAKNLPVVEDDPTRRQALMDVAMDAYVELKTKIEMSQAYKDVSATDPMEIISRYEEISREMKAEIKVRFVERYRAFASIRMG